MAVAISLVGRRGGREKQPRRPWHQCGRRGDAEHAGLTDIDVDSGLRIDGQSVADGAHVDAAIERSRTGIEK